MITQSSCPPLSPARRSTCALRDFDHCLDEPGLVVCPYRYIGDGLRKARPVRHRLAGVNLSGTKSRDDSLEVLCRRVATAEQREFPPMELRVLECDIALDDADQGVTATAR